MSADNLPYAADAESPLKESELEVLRRQFEREGQYVSIQTRFNYAWGLIKSDKAAEQRYGVKLLTGTYLSTNLKSQNTCPQTSSPPHATVAADQTLVYYAPERRRECLYYLALGNYKLGNYTEARRYNDLLLEKENQNMQAMSLKGLIEDRVAKEGMIGVAILSGVVIAAGVMGSFLYKGITKRR
ncbi:hypothetical protein ABW21_db0200441 [Orbilia brochopaga]|nr:hypothetical protein ABW21_db0200441 [Drechslerella brochopaga]